MTWRPCHAWYVSQTWLQWHPHDVWISDPIHTAYGPENRIPNLLNKLELSGVIGTVFVTLSSSLWQLFSLLISFFFFFLILNLATSLFLRSLIITPSLQWHAQQTAPSRMLKNLWKWNNTRFSHWHHPASSDRSEMPVHVKFGVKKTSVGVQTVRNSVEGPDL